MPKVARCRLSPVIASTKTHQLKLMIALPSSVDLNMILWDCIHKAVCPQQLRFGIMVECTSIHDATTEIDPILRSYVCVGHTVARKDLPHSTRRLRRLCRRFVNSDESVTVCMDYRAILQHEWDKTILNFYPKLKEGVILSSPSCSEGGIARFPCMAMSFRGVERGVSLPFHTTHKVCIVPSVCVCSEFIVARPGTLMEWVSTKTNSNVHPFVPTKTFLLPNPELDVLYMNGLPSQCRQHVSGVLKCETVGLTRTRFDRECILKFGSVSASKLAIKFGIESLT